MGSLLIDFPLIEFSQQMLQLPWLVIYHILYFSFCAWVSIKISKLLLYVFSNAAPAQMFMNHRFHYIHYLMK